MDFFNQRWAGRYGLPFTRRDGISDPSKMERALDEKERPLINLSSDEIYRLATKSLSLEEIYQAMFELLQRQPSIRKRDRVLHLARHHRSIAGLQSLLRLGRPLDALSDKRPVPEPPRMRVIWPSTEVIESNLKTAKKELDPFDRNKYSALYLCGYRVGKTSGLPEQERRELLDTFFVSRLNPLIEKHYGRDYDDPKTLVRLLKMANVIAANCRNFKRRRDADVYRQAIDDYEDDLAYLKATYYDRWPHPRPTWPNIDV